MATLHTLNKSPSADSVLKSCCAALEPGAVLVLIEDGVYNATSAIHPELKAQLDKQVKIFARKVDVQARGLTESVLPDIQLIDDAAWVELCATYQPLVSWY